jgi:AcrR family transcriptional regulator
MARDTAAADEQARRHRRAGLDDAVILRAAAAIADRDGLERLSLTQLAEELDVRPPSLYNHVNGLDDIRRGLALEGAHALAGRLARAAAGKAGVDALRAVGLEYRAFAREHPGLYAAIQRAAEPDDTELVAADADVLAVLRAALSAWNLDEATQVHAMRAFRALAHGFVTLEAVGGFGMPYDLEASYDYAMNALLWGIARVTIQADPE